MPSRAARLLLAATLTLASAAGAQDADWEDRPAEGDPAGYPVQVEAEGAATVTLEAFQSGLAPHGDWVQSGAYGTVWRPRVAGGWRPYYYGRWEWTNEGWLWVSEEPFGWATYHYGRWAWDGGAGWVWVPGYQWAPAWVSWRYGGDVVGWAPLSPGLSLYVTNYAFVDFWWTFVPTYRFCGTPVWGVAYPTARAWQHYAVTAPAPPRPRPPPVGTPPGGSAGRPPPPTARAAPGWGGPPPRYVEERTGRPVPASRIVAEPRPGAVRARPGEVGVYRPERAPPATSAPRGSPAARALPPAQPLPPAGRSAVPPVQRGWPSSPSGPASPGARPSYPASPAPQRAWPSSPASPAPSPGRPSPQAPRPSVEPGRNAAPSARPSAPASARPSAAPAPAAPRGGGGGGGGNGGGSGRAPGGGGSHQVSGGRHR